MPNILTDIQLTIDRSIYKAIEREGIFHGYIADKSDLNLSDPASMEVFKSRQQQIREDKGFCIELIGSSNSQYKSSKGTARIVVDTYGILPGTTGLDTTTRYDRVDNTFIKKNYPSRFSDYEFNVRISGSNANEVRVCNSILANALGNRRYIPKFPNTELTDSGNLFIENLDTFNESDLQEGVIEHVYRYLMPEVIVSGQLVDQQVVAALVEVTFEQEIVSTSSVVITETSCPPVTIFNIDGSFRETIAAGGTFVIPNEAGDLYVVIKKSTGAVETEVLAPGQYVINKHKILYSNGTTIVIENEFDTDFIIPSHQVLNENGAVLDETEFDQNTIVPNTKLTDESGSNLMTLVAGEDSVLPNIEVQNSLGDVILNAPLSSILSGDSQTPDSIISDEDGNTLTSLPSAKPFIVPNALVSRDGIPYGEVAPGQIIDVPSAIVPSGIFYQRPGIIQKQSYRTGDLGWHVQNGSFNFPKPDNPEFIQCLDLSSANWFTTLQFNNIFGNKERFTTSTGRVPASNAPYGFVLSDFTIDGAPSWYIIDHLTGLGLYVANVLNPSSYNWNDHIDEIVNRRNTSFLGYSDWIPMCLSYAIMVLPEVVSYLTTNASIFKMGIVSGVNETGGMWVADTRIQNAAQAGLVFGNTRWATTAKTGIAAYNYAMYMWRVHY